MPERRKGSSHRRSQPWVSSRTALYSQPAEMFISGWDARLSNDQGLSRVIERATNIDPSSQKVSVRDGLGERVHGRVAGKRLVPKGGKGTGKR